MDCVGGLLMEGGGSDRRRMGKEVSCYPRAVSGEERKKGVCFLGGSRFL